MRNLNTSFLLSEDVFSICKPLFNKFNLNAFSYSRIYKDGSRSELWSDPKAMEYSFFEKKYLGKFYTPQYLGQDRIVIYEKKIATYPKEIKMILENQLHDQKTIFNHDNALLIAEFDNNTWEYFFFYTDKNNTHAINTYLSNMEELKKFCKYFKKRGSHIIKLSDCDKLIKPINEIIFQPRLIPNNLTTLTKRETEIGYMITEGNSASEIAEILSISKRTVENHIANIKEKYNIRKKSDLIKILLKKMTTVLNE